MGRTEEAGMPCELLQALTAAAAGQKLLHDACLYFCFLKYTLRVL